MPSFRSPRVQAQRAVARLAAHGQSRVATRGAFGVSSVGTGRSYAQTLTQFAAHLQSQRAGDLASASPAQARDWLAERSAEVGQKTLDSNRQALTAWYAQRGETLDLTKAQCPSTAPVRRGLADQQRYYAREQIAAIAAHQTERNGLATRIAAEAGLRAHELGSLARPDEQPVSEREWRADRHAGRERGVSYTVKGKGGLVREVRVSDATARDLEAQRLAASHRATDRGVHQQRRYDLGAGNAWSRSFTDASRRACGFSQGAHGVRHTYAHERMDTLQRLGYRYPDALGIVAQELGHWRAETTETYLR